MSRLISFIEAAERIDKCFLAAQQHKSLDGLRQDLIHELFVVHRNGFDAGLLKRVRATPKRFYSAKEVAEFSVDGTDWRGMLQAALDNIERGNFSDRAIEDVRRMGELTGLSNKQIGPTLANRLHTFRRKG